jgi:DNA-binding winged helix-turn-helix (wHTH) protein/Flp pilus assembly protein TadD
MNNAQDSVVFGPFRLDPLTPRLERDGSPVELRPQALAALESLLLHTGHFVDYDSMIREAWGGVVVSKHTVAVTVGEVKKVLKEFGSWITYRPRLGYRLEVPHSEDLIRHANHYWNRFTREGLEKALLCYRRAAEQDSNDFRALEGIASAYLLLGTLGMQPAPEMYQKFLEAHRRAVAVGGMTPDLRSERAHGLHVFERRLDQAETEITRAYRDRPESAPICIRLAMFYATTGRLDAAAAMLARVESADPLIPTLPSTEVFIRVCRHEVDLALAAGAQAVELHPYVPLGRAMYAMALEAAGRWEDARKQYQQASMHSPDLPWLRALEGAAAAQSGGRAEALEILEELEHLREIEYVDAYFMAILLHALERHDAAFRELERACDEESATLFLLDADPRLDPLRADPRFACVRERVFAHSGWSQRLHAAG